MIRKATLYDIEKIAETYTRLLAYEKEHGSTSNWKPGLYPTIKVPQDSVPKGTMFVLEENGAICASMILNQNQLPEYSKITLPEKRISHCRLRRQSFSRRHSGGTGIS